VRFLLAVLILLSFTFAEAARAQTPKAIYPQTDWQVVSPEEVGWSKAKLEDAHKFFETLPEASAMVVYEDA
jgi:hypothetical protein